MKLDLFSHEARLVVLWGQADVMDATLLLVMTDGASQDRRGPAGLY
jgi:hypothetical protein